MYKKILLAIDGSENSLRAAAEAAKLAKADADAVVEIVYVTVPPKTAREILLEPSKEEQEKVRNAKIQPVEKILDDAAVQHKTSIITGEAAPAIVQHSKTAGADIIVIGSRGLNAVQKFVLGGVSNDVVQKATVPVLLVK
ncbi:universal stress protein [Wohlfahrtiimonas chitiniclastica]|uniref:universal stress protein n=1 Tax=Wohlfahrtiimonas chitiniclastica TaxID=400946 RepID=UPI00037E3081|nr:universal stress protein [Wohlfahrtiimonas chitiniclastica]